MQEFDLNMTNSHISLPLNPTGKDECMNKKLVKVVIPAVISLYLNTIYH